MPRPKVTEEARRRVAKACLRCQEAKHKCDGLTPCAQCSKRGRVSECEYSPLERSYGRRRRRRNGPRQDDRESHGSTTPRSTDTEEIPRPLSPMPKNRQPREAQRTLHVRELNIPRKSHMLYDTSGRIVYLGDCAAPTFLQHLQGFLESELHLSAEQSGFSKLTAIEEIPRYEVEARPPAGPGSVSDLQDLIDVFFISSCGILDIIDHCQVDDLLQSWSSYSLADTGRTAVLFLILAYGAQSRSGSVADMQYSQYYYHHGRRLALLELTNEPSVETVQAFVLISLYMLASSQRNASFLNLGIAISAAKSLGFHRDDVNAMFPENNTHLRSRIWRTLRYHDLFFCAMMGRTPSTLTTDSYYSDKPDQDQFISGPDSGQQLALTEAVRAFSILERTISEIYTKNTASLAHLESLARELQAATSNIPPELRTVTTAESPEQRHVIRNAHVACSYYFSMMLLTRPFLISCIQQKCSRAGDKSISDVQPTEDEDLALSPEITQGALASIDSAIHVIQLIHELLTTRMLFNNMVLIIAMVFVASLTICSAHLGRLGYLASNELAIRQAEEILKHFSHHTRQGKRYGYILKKLYKAARVYREAVERRSSGAPTLEMPALFSLSNSGHEEAWKSDNIPSERQENVEKDQECCGGSDSSTESSSTPGNSLPIEAAFWGPAWQEGLWLTSPEISITDIIDSFNQGGGDSITDNMPFGGIQGFTHPGSYQSGHIWGFD